MGLFRHLLHLSRGGPIPFFELSFAKALEQARIAAAVGDSFYLMRDFLLQLAAKCRDL